MTKQARFLELDGDIWCIDALYTAPEIACCYLLKGGDEFALVETGTARSLDNILASFDAIGVEADQLKYVIPTHVHLDHAGCAGQLMQHFPQAQLLIHPLGARHMIDPTRLVASSLRVYGEDLFTQLYGEILPVAEDRVQVLEDGERFSVGERALSVAHTRGHADHHFCVFDDHTRGWFSGDMFGVSYPALRFEGGAFVMPATTPTQFDPDLYCESIDRLAAQGPDRFYLTHFGPLEFSPAQAALLKDQLQLYAKLGNGAQSEESLQEAVRTITMKGLRTVTDPVTAQARATGLKMDAALNAQGIAVWRQRRAA